MSGKIIPPTLPPVVARPVAAARLRRKKCAIEEMAGVKIKDVPRPAATEKERTKCHNSVKKVQSLATLEIKGKCKELPERALTCTFSNGKSSTD